MSEIKTITFGDPNGVETLISEGKACMKPSGGSMKPIINSKDKILLSIVDLGGRNYKVGEAVYCKVNGRYYVHLIKAVRKQGKNWEFQIGNNRGGINGWTLEKNIFATVLTVNGKFL